MIWNDELDMWYINQRWDCLDIRQIRDIIREFNLLEDYEYE